MADNRMGFFCFLKKRNISWVCLKSDLRPVCCRPIIAGHMSEESCNDVKCVGSRVVVVTGIRWDLAPCITSALLFCQPAHSLIPLSHNQTHTAHTAHREREEKKREAKGWMALLVFILYIPNRIKR